MSWIYFSAAACIAALLTQVLVMAAVIRKLEKFIAFQHKVIEFLSSHLHREGEEWKDQ